VIHHVQNAGSGMILQVKVVDLSKISVFEELGSDTGGFSQLIHSTKCKYGFGKKLGVICISIFTAGLCGKI
jgi:hypothetical protein